MSRLLIALSLVMAAACGARGGGEAAWPKSAGRVETTADKDGGESLEPQQAVSIAAVERAEDKTPAKGEVETIVVEAPARPVEIPPLPAGAGDPKPPAGEITIEVIEIKPEDIQIEP
jgi:hypothetical protein